ncbi:transmembrane protease serine 9-like [Onthophagus taurus]|uniref:transmembrane protease serine 9-like n=1 Tax=Onthophagus taurus TaxID=166361 RepID=UPI0039BE6DD2
MGRKCVIVFSIFLVFQSISAHPTFNKNQELRDDDLLDVYLDNNSNENVGVLKADNLDGLQWDNDEYLSKSYDNDEYNEYNEHSFNDHVENSQVHNIKKRESNETTSDVINEEVKEENENNQEETATQEESQPESTGNEEAPQENINEEETGDSGTNVEEKTEGETVIEEGTNTDNPNLEENQSPTDNEEVNKDVANEETQSEETPSQETPVQETHIEEAPIGENPIGETPIGETPIGETPIGETLIEETPIGETPVEETPIGETPIEETANEETANEETANEETPIEETANEQNPINSPSRSALNTHADLTLDTEEFKILYLPVDITPGSQTPQTRIVGGTRVTNREDFAYQASFRLSTGQHFCGATIIDDTNVLTAAHCVYDDNQKLLPAARLIIVVGDLNVKEPNEHTVIRAVQVIVPHPNYNYKTFQNDVAILRIESLGEFTNYVNKIELARTTPSVGTRCVVSGWGKTSFNGLSSAELRQVTVPIVSQKDCEIGYPYGILDGMICAGLMEGGKDACQGDSGGPLVCDNKLAGIVSWGKDCALKNHPGVYTDVAAYYNWIRIQQGLEDRIEGEIPTDIEPRTTGLIAQRRDEFPYQASLRYIKPDYHFCGATIIDFNHLITSANCVMNDTNVIDPESLSVVVGDINLLENTDSTEYRTVTHIFTHPDFNQSTFENDIAVIRVSEPFEAWTQDIKAIELAETSPEAYSSCIVSGWGAASNPLRPNENLRYASIPIIENRTCTEKYSGGIHNGMFCAGFFDKGKDTCQGDAGGPLVCNNKLSGIVSWGHRCINEGLPGVYTDIAQYRTWVDEQKARSSSNLLKNSTFVLAICFFISKLINL